MFVFETNDVDSNSTLTTINGELVERFITPTLKVGERRKGFLGFKSLALLEWVYLENLGRVGDPHLFRKQGPIKLGSLRL